MISGKVCHSVLVTELNLRTSDVGKLARWNVHRSNNNATQPSCSNRDQNTSSRNIARASATKSEPALTPAGGASREAVHTVQAVLFDLDSTLCSGAIELVRECRRAGLKTAVASSADRLKVQAKLQAAGFDAPCDFDAIISADEMELLKPAPDAFLAAAQALGVHPVACVVMGDAPAGIQAARAAGMRYIGVATSLTNGQMAANSPDLVKRSISELYVEDVVGRQGDSAHLLDRAASIKGACTSGKTAHQESESRIEGQVGLPWGFTTRRRELLKLLPLMGAFGAAYSLAQNSKALSYVSPRAIWRALTPGAGPPSGSGGFTSEERVAAFKRYIAEKEKRGALEDVPEFQPGLTWFNTAPLKLSRELRGKVLVYDFWTFCCVNCMHVLPSLAALEDAYAGQPFAVVGVHSAKFDNEKDDSSIRSAILRYDVRHPCVNDGNMVLWRDLGISSWPTLAVISPRGKLIAALPGEGQEQALDAFIRAALSYYGERGELDASPLPLALEKDKDSRLAVSPLRFPGKVAADVAGNRLFISDSSNHRIVVTDLDGKFVDHIGGNGPQLKDGSYEEAAFHGLQGLAYDEEANALYVADTENHALRKVDLTAKQVQTLAGNGYKGSDYVGGRRGRNQQLNSPWDLALDKDALYIAMAGQHQIWRHSLATGVTSSLSGDGAERYANGSSGKTTSWAQPSGLSLSADGRRLWIADSESSSVRSLSLADASSEGHVGGDPVFSENLFRFGDKDGRGSDARLQHPLAVLALPDGKVLVADSYNHKLKVLDPRDDSISTVAGSGVAGFADGIAKRGQLAEPGGLAGGPDGTVFIADTNNSLIRKFTPGSKSLTTVEVKEVPAPRVSPTATGNTADGTLPTGMAVVAVEPIQASAGELRVTLGLPKGYHLTKGANSSFEVSVSRPGALAVEPAFGAFSSSDSPSATIQFRRSGPTKARVRAEIYYCQEEDVCLFEEVVFDLPFAEDFQGEQVVDLSYNVRQRASSL